MLRRSKKQNNAGQLDTPLKQRNKKQTLTVDDDFLGMIDEFLELS